MRRKAVVSLIVATVLLLALVVQLEATWSNTYLKETDKLVEASALTTHAPIFIDGNSGFVPANGVTGGSGTASDPYIIEGWDINAATAHGIEIRNTTSYFTIRNVTVHDGSPNNYGAIVLQNVTNGIVTNVTSTNNNGLALLSSVSNTKVLNSTALGGHGYISVSSSRNNVIAFNYVQPYGWGGINVDGEYNDVIGNTITNWGNGINLGGYFNNIIGNKISPPGTWYGIAIWYYGGNHTIVGNDVSGGNNAFLLAGSSGNNITGNRAHHSSLGMRISGYVHPCSSNYVVGNIVEDNYYGIYTMYEGYTPFGNFIYNNYLRNTINAYDIGTNNWNTSKTKGTNILGGPYLGGNYYSNYIGTDSDHDGIGDTPYYIPGGGSSVDYLPLIKAPKVSVYPESIVGPAPKIGETFTVNITIANVTDLYTWQAGMTFNPNVLEALSIAEGEFLKRAGVPTLWTPGTINNPLGTISYSACSVTGATPGVTGSGQLMSVTFRVKGSGNSTLHITDVLLLDHNLVSITPVTIVDGHVEIHVQDIAILSVTTSATEAYPTWIVPFNVTVVVENQGTRTETFDVTVYANTLVIETKSVTLAAGATTTLVYNWNLASVAEDTYTIRAEATILYGEVDTADNTKTDGTVKIKHPGDANDDSVLNAYDLGILAKAWGTSVGEPLYDARADFNGDETIDTLDHDILKAYWP
jgi:parallel beta-helix repeat protein